MNGSPETAARAPMEKLHRRQDLSRAVRTESLGVI